MQENTYEVAPMTLAENEFLISSCASSELIELYENVRRKILLYGKIELRVTRDYINFRHPYKKWNPVIRKKEIAMGTLINIYVRKDSLTLAFNTLGKLPKDHKNILKKASSFGVCDYIANIKPDDNIDDLDTLIQQSIRFVSNEARVVRINNKFISL